MLEVITQYAPLELVWIGLAVFLYSLNKGGFPVSSIAVPILILMWPSRVEPAKTVVGFLLPLLVVMDIFGMVAYWRHIQWKKILPLLPATVVAIAVASILFVSKANAFLYLPDKWLQLFIACIGIIFIGYHAAQRWIRGKIEEEGKTYGWFISSLFGFGAGVASTLANSAVPIAQMYYLPQKLEKMQLAANITGYFFIVNLLKMVPFSLLGRIETENLLLGVWLLPLIPAGVFLGKVLVKKLPRKYYIGFIYAVLGFTSILIIVRTFTG